MDDFKNINYNLDNYKSPQNRKTWTKYDIKRLAKMTELRQRISQHIKKLRELHKKLERINKREQQHSNQRTYVKFQKQSQNLDAKLGKHVNHDLNRLTMLNRAIDDMYHSNLPSDDKHFINKERQEWKTDYDKTNAQPSKKEINQLAKFDPEKSAKFIKEQAFKIGRRARKQRKYFLDNPDKVDIKSLMQVPGLARAMGLDDRQRFAKYRNYKYEQLWHNQIFKSIYKKYPNLKYNQQFQKAKAEINNEFRKANDNFHTHDDTKDAFDVSGGYNNLEGFHIPANSRGYHLTNSDKKQIMQSEDLRDLFGVRNHNSKVYNQDFVKNDPNMDTFDKTNPLVYKNGQTVENDNYSDLVDKTIQGSKAYKELARQSKINKLMWNRKHQLLMKQNKQHNHQLHVLDEQYLSGKRDKHDSQELANQIKKQILSTQKQLKHLDKHPAASLDLGDLIRKDTDNQCESRYYKYLQAVNFKKTYKNRLQKIEHKQQKASDSTSRRVANKQYEDLQNKALKNREYLIKVEHNNESFPSEKLLKQFKKEFLATLDDNEYNEYTKENAKKLHNFVESTRLKLNHNYRTRNIPIKHQMANRVKNDNLVVPSMTKWQALLEIIRPGITTKYNIGPQQWTNSFGREYANELSRNHSRHAFAKPFLRQPNHHKGYINQMAGYGAKLKHTVKTYNPFSRHKDDYTILRNMHESKPKDNLFSQPRMVHSHSSSNEKSIDDKTKDDSQDLDF